VRLLDPAWLWAAALVPVALWWSVRRWPSVLFSPAGFTGGLPRSWRARLLSVPWLLQAGGLLLVVAALARPVERVALPLVTEGIDIMLCLDTSSSMTAGDLDETRTRLDVAKQAAAQFVAGRRHDRIGLLCFARYPDVRCPPTLDHDALHAFVGAVTLVDGEGPEDATGIGTAVARAAQVLGASDAKSRVVILLTDGEENIATTGAGEIAPLHAAQLARRLGVRVYAVAAGLGRRGPTGDWVDLDTSAVRGLAERTGGRFFTARDADAVANVYAEIDTLEKASFREPRFREEERFLPLLAAAVSLLFVARLLRATVWAVTP